MKTFIATSSEFKGHIKYVFNKDNILINLDLSECEIKPEYHYWVIRNAPLTPEYLVSQYAKSKTAKIEEFNPNITFDMFWNRYDNKVNSSKKRTEAKWNKMSLTERLKAFNYVNRYFMSIPAGTRKKYAETYLNAELWNN
jgi:hypothetical protein